MSDATEQDRQELVRRARSRRTRRARFTPGSPTKWHPTSCGDPRCGDPFTVDNCWEFVADAIESGAAVEVIQLRKPHGKRGFVVMLDGIDGTKIYVKLQLSSDVVLGRSFHASTGPQDKEDDDG